MKSKVLVIAGPTAVGKTKIAIEVAKRLNGEIISADSMQIYKKMDIGTAKPTIEEMDGITHHLLSIVEIGEKFSVVDFQKMAFNCIEDILNRGKVPIVCGGTGLYINGLIEEIDYGEVTSSDELREELEKVATERGNEYLYEELKAVDKESAERIKLNDTKRLIRALEVYKVTGTTITEFQRRSKEKEKKYDYIVVGLSMEREKLYERINLRVDLMMKDGLLDEAKAVLDEMNSNDKLTSFQAIGYKEFLPFFDGTSTLDEVGEMIKQESRRYAKRQVTWFKRTPGLRWVDVSDVNAAISEIVGYYTE